MKLTIAAYAFCAAAAAWLMRFELRTDDSGVVVFFVLAITFVLGLLHPRHAWQWALLVGPSIPAVHLIYGARDTDLTNAKNYAILLAFVIALGIAGSYAGALLRKALSPAVRHGV